MNDIDIWKRKILIPRALVLFAALLSGNFATAAENADTGYIDIHFHADARVTGGGDLPKVAEYMKANNVTRCIILQFRKSLPRNEDERRMMIENFGKYKGKMYRFCVLFASEVKDKEEAIKILTGMKSEGAIGFGEHYGEKLFFDDPKCMQLYAACEEVGLPVLFHMDGGNNKDDKQLSHLENALKTYPKCTFIGHGPGFWAKMKTMDGLLGKYSNLYADISAGSGARAIGNDKKYSREFMIRHADRVMFGTDGGPWSLKNMKPPAHFKLIDSLNLPAEIRANVCRENAKKLFRFDGP